VLWGITGLCTGHELLGSIAFSLALNYKQMELYHALPFFCFLLGSCVQRCKQAGLIGGLWKLTKIGAVVIATFAVCWLPFIAAKDLSVPLQVLRRLFPFDRGLYEDKVANVWCSLSILIKLKQIFDVSQLIRICLLSTVLAVVPSSLNLLYRPSPLRLKYCLINSSLAFFLFSFQVHEKSILLAALPVCLLFPHDTLAVVWFLLISTFSMLPLLLKDGLVIAYISSMIMFYLLCDVLIDQLHLATPSVQHLGVLHQAELKNTSKHVSSRSTQALTGSQSDQQTASQSDKHKSQAAPTISTQQDQASIQHITMHSSSTLSLLFWLSIVGMILLTAASLVLKPPAQLPDLFPVLVSAYSCAHFVLFLLYFHWRQFTAKDEAYFEKNSASVASSKRAQLKQPQQQQRNSKLKQQ